MNDWTAGGPRLCFDECRACARRWTLPRAACPYCGTPDPRRSEAAGTGTVAALTVVHRAPESGHHPPTPFVLVLVDLDEGIRVMGRAAGVSAIGERTVAGFPDGLPTFVPCG